MELLDDYCCLCLAQTRQEQQSVRFLSGNFSDLLPCRSAPVLPKIEPVLVELLISLTLEEPVGILLVWLFFLFVLFNSVLADRSAPRFVLFGVRFRHLLTEQSSCNVQHHFGYEWVIYYLFYCFL
jgi:hypothetical protein